MEEVNSSPITKNVLFERHSVIEKEDNPSSYNIEEIFGALTFNLHKKEVCQKRVRKVKQIDGSLEEMQEDEVLFAKTEKYLVTVATVSTILTQAATHNITLLNEEEIVCITCYTQYDAY